MSDEPPKAESAPKKPKLVIVLLVLNLGATGFTTFKVVTAKPPAEASGEKHGSAGSSAPATNEIVGPVVAIAPFVVNLDEPGPSRYLKMTLQFELVVGEADVEEMMKKSEQLIRDTIIGYVSGLKIADTLGANAKDKLRVEIMKKLEEIIGPHKVRRMFFQEFMVQ